MKSASTTLLLPREHGAYAQLGVSLLSGLSFGFLFLSCWAQTLASLALFFASEPLMAATGRRGPSPSVKRRGRARLILWLSLASAFGVFAWWGVNPRSMLSLIPAAALGAVLTGLFLAGKAHTSLGELVAALALSASCLPVAILGTASVMQAWNLTGILASIHILGTLTVRAHMYALRLRHPLARGIPPLLGSMGLGIGLLRPPLAETSAAWALLPITLGALWIATTPSRINSFKKVGWILVIASFLGAVLALAGIHKGP